MEKLMQKVLLNLININRMIIGTHILNINMQLVRMQTFPKENCLSNRSSDNLKLLKMNQSKIQFEDIWEKRTIMFYLLDRKQRTNNKRNHQPNILLFGWVKTLNSPVKYTNCQLNQKTQLYFLNLQLEPQEVTNPIKFQIYMQAQFKEQKILELIEIITKSLKLTFRNQPINICEEITLESKCYFLK
ncbi:unnamed protein product [Paramecium sonneborni]|uniref:Uncharacterized protein n=1 Tax=Paramecium sonneborni TaxID=65129 RepID=A0A8S1RNA7_9CILI|nr:unnamed protein product [Paramecium sonneborni]